MTDKIIFFNDEDNISILAEFKKRIDYIPSNPEIPDFEKHRNDYINLIIGFIKERPEFWDDFCQINIKWIGKSFLISCRSTIKEEPSKNELDDIFSMCFRFFLELYLSTNIDHDLENVYDFAVNNLESFEDRPKQRIEFAIKRMPIVIFKEITNTSSIASIKNLDNTLSKAEQLKEKWDKDLIEREEQVNKLKDNLTEYETAFNFVGLYNGFDELSVEKNEEKKNLLFWLRILGVIIVTPILIEFIIIFLNIKDITSIQEGLIISILPTISFVAISIYYFRVLLFNYKSVKSQLLQIELRKTLCRFIQNYADYSSEIKKEDADALSKFENIIFSGIVMDEGALPSNFDGFEQIVKIMKSIKISH
ncbi:hypothetical protein QUF74_12845 [Candidatus Halobeggiatoa sp. HSG11]|nr:hypothetical protein [Candidatus Halobeggiatoa sp. HSG11]